MKYTGLLRIFYVCSILLISSGFLFADITNPSWQTVIYQDDFESYGDTPAGVTQDPDLRAAGWNVGGTVPFTVSEGEIVMGYGVNYTFPVPVSKRFEVFTEKVHFENYADNAEKILQGLGSYSTKWDFWFALSYIGETGRVSASARVDGVTTNFDNVYLGAGVKNISWVVDGGQVSLYVNEVQIFSEYYSYIENLTYPAGSTWVQGTETPGAFVHMDGILIITDSDPADCKQVWSSGYGKVTDLNKDCEVNFEDFAKVASQWLDCNHPDPAECNN